MSADADRLETLVQSLHAADRDQRIRELQEAILHLTGDMNGRGLLFSSMCVNGIGDLCRVALVDLTNSLWNCTVRAHASAAGAPLAAVRTAFMQNLEATFASVEGVHRGSTDRFATALQNKSMMPQNQVKEEHERLLLKYTAELDMYESTRAATSAATRFEAVKQRILSRPIVLVPALAIAAILALAAFADAFSSLGKRIAGWVTGEG